MGFNIQLGYVSREKYLGNYYLDFSLVASSIEKGDYGPFDRDGIPLVDYDQLFKLNRVSKKDEYYGIHYTPVTINHYAFDIFRRYNLTQSIQDKELFLKFANWLYDNLKNTKDGFGVWLHSFDFPHYELKAPWVSAMAQGEGISVLLRAYEITQNCRYIDAAHKALLSFKFDVSGGGVSCADRFRNVWFEEIPTQPYSHVLNGFIFSLFGVYDFYRVTGDDNAHLLFESGVNTLRQRIHNYDLGFWSRYDLLSGRVASSDYHNLHILQLKILYTLTDDRIFDEFANRWKNYASRPVYIIQRKLFSKIRHVLGKAGLKKVKKIRGISFAFI